MKLRTTGRRWLLVWGLSLVACPGLLSAEKAKRNVLTAAPGTRWATPCYVHDSGAAGPSVMVIAGLHGDEPAGVWAAEEIGHWPITRGKLLLLPRANLPALQANAHQLPGVDRSHGSRQDENAHFAHAARSDDSPAQALWPTVAAAKLDWLVDLHEGLDTRQQQPHGSGSSIATDGTARGRKAAQAVRAAINATIGGDEQKFVISESPCEGSLVAAVREECPARTLVLATTSQDQPLALRIRQQRVMLHAFLEHVGLIDGRVPVDMVCGAAADRSPLRIAIYAGPGTRKGMLHLIREVEQLSDATVVPLGADEIEAGALEHFQVVVFPGGSSTKQGESLGEANRRKVQEFVQRGGGYVGICAGAYLATTEFPWSLQILDAKPCSAEKYRGRGTVAMELTPAGRKILGADQRCCEVRYHNGPILMRAQRADLPDFQPWAVFRSEVSESGTPAGLMVGAPAIVAGRYGRGRVVCFSPHPDQTRGLEELVRRGLRWAAEGDRPERLTGVESPAAKPPAAAS